jgi:sigma-B regulation protein RsbU (phosphoserine phosphatase)
MVVGVLDPKTGVIEFANAGHVAPLVISKSGVAQLTMTDMVVGLFSQAKYRNQSVTLDAGDTLVLFTDGVTEAENEIEEQLGLDPVAQVVSTMHGTAAPQILDTIENHVQEFVGNAPLADDLTMLALTRL